MKTPTALSILLLTATACASNVEPDDADEMGEAEGALELSLSPGIYEHAQYGSSLPSTLLVAQRGGRTVVVQPDSTDCALRYSESLDAQSHRAGGRGCEITLMPVEAGGKPALKIFFSPISADPDARKRDEAVAPVYLKRADDALRGKWSSVAVSQSISIESSTDDRIIGTLQVGASPVKVTAKRPTDWLERAQAQTYPFEYNVSFVRETCRGELRVTRTPRRRDQAIEVRFASCGTLYESSTVHTRSGYAD